jgi:hypothetical protein
MVTHMGSGDGYGIQWVAGNGAALAPGKSLTFGFESVDTPAQIAGVSVIDSGNQVTTSFVYQGGPFSGASELFVAAQQGSVPEPSSLALGLAALLGTVIYAGVRRAREGWIHRSSGLLRRSA